jgi:hypothetical protein
MRTKLLSALSLSILASGLSAQIYTGEGPGIVVPAALNPKLGATGLGNGVTEVGQILLVPHASLGSNVYYACFTVKRTGGAGGWDYMTGTYNGNNDVFTKNNDCDHLNTTGDEFAATVTSDLLVFGGDTTTTPKYATRTATTMPFGTMANIGGAPAGYIDSQFGRIAGNDVYFYIAGIDLWVADFNRTTGALSNNRRVVTNPTGAGCHSPSPMNDATGEARALIFSARPPARQSTPWFASSLNDRQPAFQIMDATTWWANPDANGGTLNYAEAPSTYTDPQKLGIVATNSSRIPGTGGNLNITVFAPQRTAPAVPYVGYVALGTLASSPLDLSALPFVGGNKKLALAPIAMWLPLGPVSIVDGSASLNVPVPALGPGIQAHTQSLIVDATSGTVYMGSTALIETF